MVDWFLPFGDRRDADTLLFCLPHAGGGPAVFRHWAGRLPPGTVPLALTLPGRGPRLAEPPVVDLDALADAAAAAMGEGVDRPFSVFGHSLGAWLGWEVVRRLEAGGRPPLRLVVSGRQAPTWGHLLPPLHGLDDDDLVRSVQSRYGGVPDEVLRAPDLLKALLPALRADLRALETYEPRGQGPISTPILALGGASDRVAPPASLDGWHDATTGDADVVILPGGHFFFQEHPEPFFRALTAALPGPGGGHG